MPKTINTALYKSFQDWISAHRHSACTIESECKQCFENAKDGGLSDIEALENFVDHMEELHNEAQGEIDEAQEWIKRLQKEKQDKARKHT